MCGIAGIISKNISKVTVERLKLMTDSIAHRGPDGEGHWISENGMVGFGHRRLSIIDLSSFGAQPMHYANGRYTITFNGEIYNYLEIKKGLQAKGYTFNSNSDTEVLLALYDAKREKCLEDLDGMFSFAIYDEQVKSVFFARDRFGEKPLFYTYNGKDEFHFGSEMKELWAAGIPKDVNNKMLYNYLSYGLLENANDQSETFYEGIQKLEAAHYIILKLNDFSLIKKRYWDIDINNVDYNTDITKASEKFQSLFYDSVKKRLRSDVPVGSSLSGGLDSSLIVCVINDLLVNKSSPVKQKTFSARFPGFEKDEGKYMDLVNTKTKAESFFTFPNEIGLIEKIEKVAYHQEEPFGSASICVQFDVMKLAKDNGVIVLLDGQGADELLGGYHYYYNSYFEELKNKDKGMYERALADYNKLHALNAINKNVSPGFKKRIKNAFPFIIKPYFQYKNALKELINPSLNREFTNNFADKSYLGLNFDLYAKKSLNEALYYSTMTKGLSELLRYSDRNSMAHSREVRLPFLNHKLVEFLFTLPAEFKISKGWTKYIMRETFQHILPNEITWRKDKIGYEPPQKAWMDTALAKEMIQSKKELLVSKGVLNKRVLNQTPRAVSATDENDSSWRQWMAGSLFS
ncbi:asparagine synthase (glutamine-hydrolyzing) [Pedobacter flavus]|uniref:asparagine synthase (glutamine-hydrolyzing) n=1 Tax=Pedobacter flavus TaxID=3113906 RepID=A0ABU7H097_9SPHI|nr:asparagine synthase (glutamine-hydrolyzing) [Pedobacter sp. VNH31]MEE1884709.1 asparagine synthase (glutamine-hydrolyzing) [Pedobacter sp. VNH31]